MNLLTRTLMMSSGGGTSGSSAYWIATGTGISLHSIDVDSSGNVYAAGEDANGFYIVKLNSSGSTQWQRVVSTQTNDVAFGVTVANDGSVYVAGRYDGASTILSLLIKYDSSGTQQWVRTLSTVGFNSHFKSVHWDSDSAIYVAGYTDNTANASGAMLLAKYDSTGALSWVRTLDNGATFEEALGVSSASAGNVTMAGYSDTVNSNAAIAQYNSTGTIQWQRTLTGSNAETFDAVCVDASANVFVSGYTSSQGAGGSDALIAKYNSTGTLQWQRSLGGTGSEVGDGVAVDSAGNVYMVGTTSSQGAGGNDVLIAKYNTSGTIQWQRALGTTAGDTGRAVIVGPSDILYVLGNNMIAKLPNDGTLTGIYGTTTYQTTTLTDASRTLTAATSTYTGATGSDTSSTPTITSNTASTTFSTVNL